MITVHGAPGLLELVTVAQGQLEDVPTCYLAGAPAESEPHLTAPT